MDQERGAQKSQKALTEATKESKDFNAMKKQEQKNNAFDRTKAGKREIHNNGKY